MGAFKFRGAYNAIAQIPAERRERGVVTASSAITHRLSRWPRRCSVRAPRS